MIITNTNPGNFTVDGVYVEQIQALPAIPAGPQTGRIGIVGTANYGPVDQPIAFSAAADLMAAFGNGSGLTNSLVLDALLAMPECSDFVGVRVTDGTDVAATIALNDSTGYASGTLTVGGTFAAGVAISATIGTTTVNYTTQAGDTNLNGVAASLAAKINASAAVVGGSAVVQQVTVSGAIITVTALTQGTAGNSIALAGTGTGVTVTASGATLTGGVAPGVVATLTEKYTGSFANGASARLDLQSGTLSAKPIFRVTIYFPNQNPEVFSGIVGYATSAYDAPTFKANLLAAVNGTIANKAGSVRWSASSGSSTANPLTATVFNASGGTDGASGVGSAQLVGTDGTTSRTGIYALRGMIQAGQLLIAELDDATIGATLVAFATSENCLVHMAFAQGTTTDSAVSTKQANNLTNASLITSIDWDEYFDSIAGLQKLVAPSAKVAGVIASLPAYLYPGNKPYTGVAGIIGTERTATPISLAEGGERESNGLLYITNNAQLFNRAVGYGLPHGLASDGSLISDVRMLKAISYELQAILGPLVGEMQGTSVNDPFRRLVNDRLDQYFQSLLTSNPAQINSYKVVDDTSNNTSTTVAQGLNIASIQVQTLSAARFILAAVQVGSTVQIVTSTAG